MKIFVPLQTVKITSDDKHKFHNGDNFMGRLAFNGGDILCCDGHGRKTYPGCGVFEGEFKDCLPYRGKLISEKGVTSEGFFDKTGKLSEGKKTLKCGAIFEGKFDNSKQASWLIEGKISYPDGNTEEGEFRNYKLVKGKKIFADGEIQDGEYEGDDLIKGKIIHPSGDFFDGILKNMEPVFGYGRISLSDSDKEIFRGFIVNGDLYNGIILEGNTIKAEVIKNERVNLPDNEDVRKHLRESFNVDKITNKKTRMYFQDILENI